LVDHIKSKSFVKALNVLFFFLEISFTFGYQLQKNARVAE